jgi:hypothetical protein
MIGGREIKVEIDECKIAKRKYNRGHVIKGAWAFGGVERTSQRGLFVEVVPDRTAQTLSEVIQRRIHPESIILPDCWRGYTQLSNMGFTHMTVNHSKNFLDPITQTHTNGIEATWSAIKRAIAIRNRNKDSVEGKVLTFIWIRQNRENLWDAFITAMASTHFD